MEFPPKNMFLISEIGCNCLLILCLPTYMPSGAVCDRKGFRPKDSAEILVNFRPKHFWHYWLVLVIKPYWDFRPKIAILTENWLLHPKVSSSIKELVKKEKFRPKQSIFGGKLSYGQSFSFGQILALSQLLFLVSVFQQKICFGSTLVWSCEPAWSELRNFTSF